MTNRVWIAFAFACILAASNASAQQPKAVTQGITDTEIVIGTHSDLSGPVAAAGSEGRDGMLLKIDEINSAGGIHGRKIRLVVEDTAYDTKKAILATQKLIDRDKIFALVFPFGTPTSLASLPLLREAGIPLLFPGSGAVQFHTPLDPLTFAYFLPDDFFMKLGVEYAVKNLNPKRIGVIYQDDDYGQAMLAGARDALKKNNLELVETASYQRGATDFSSHVAKMKAAGVDLILLGTVLRETVAVARERQKIGWDVKLLGGFPVYSQLGLVLGKDAMEGVYAVGQNKIFYPDTAPAAVQDWTKRLKEKYSRDAGPTALASYNAVAMFAEAAKAAGPKLTVESLLEGFNKINYQDIFESAPVTFSSTNHLMPRKAFVAQVKNQRWQTLTPYLSE